MSEFYMENTCLLTIDAGTTSIKISLFDQRLKLLACSVQEYKLSTAAQRVEAPAGIYLDAVCAGAYAVRREVKNAEISAICITTQGETLVALDKNGVPLTPFIVWLDARAEKQAEELSQRLTTQRFYEQTGLPEISAALPLCKVMWLRENEPEIYKKTSKFLLLEDYLLFWLTGKAVSEKSIQTSTGWFNLKTDGYWSEMLDMAQIDPEKLPELLESGTLVGGLTKAVARLLDLDENVQVVTGTMDQTASALAVGCNEEGVVTETTGTALVMTACTDKPVFNSGHRLTVYRHAISGKFLYIPIANTAGIALKWFRDEFCKDISNSGYSAMDVLATGISPGCDGLVFLPFLAGRVDPDSCPQAKAMFFGATLSTTRPHFARSIFEAVGFMLHDFIDMLEILNVDINYVISLGGGSRSSLWQQIKADICNRSFFAADCSEAASQGAALLAMWGTGILPYGTLPEKKRLAEFEPNMENKEAYETAYSLYKNLYNAVRPLF